MRHGLTAYDAAYLALAEVLDARLVTRDYALAKTGSHVRVEVV
jgi:predicted nucleic acid-binding protein